MPIPIQEYILGFKIAIHNAPLMQVLYGQDNLGGIELGDILGEFPVFSQKEEKLAPCQQVHQQVQIFAVLEGVVQLHDEGVVCRLQD